MKEDIFLWAYQDKEIIYSIAKRIKSFVRIIIQESVNKLITRVLGKKIKRCNNIVYLY